MAGALVPFAGAVLRVCFMVMVLIRQQHERCFHHLQPAIDLGPPFAPMIEALYARAMALGLLRP